MHFVVHLLNLWRFSLKFESPKLVLVTSDIPKTTIRSTVILYLHAPCKRKKKKQSFCNPSFSGEPRIKCYGGGQFDKSISINY